MKVTIQVIAMFLTTACGTSTTGTPFDYIVQAQNRDESWDVAADVRECASALEKLSGQRSALQEQLRSKGVLASPAYVVIEVTSLGWGGYHYSYLWLDEGGAGRIVSTMTTRMWGKRTEGSLPAGELRELLDQALSSRSRIDDSVNRVVDDGPCFLVRAKRGATVDQLAVYAPNRGDRAVEVSERFVDRALNLIDKYAVK